MAHRRISVSQLRCAVVDARWRQDWLGGKSPTTLVPANGQPNVHGSRFHQETERLAKWLIAPKNLAEAARIASSRELLQIAWKLSLQEFADELIAQGKVEEAAVFTERMRSFCDRLIALKKRTRNFENWQDVFIATEASLENIIVPIGSSTVEIGARVDAIRFHPQHDLEVVDYKLTQGSQQKSDFIQLAIYAHLLPLWRPGCRFCGTVEYYLPKFMAVPVSAEELADIYRGLVEPVLRETFDTAKHGSAKLAGSDRRGVAKPGVDGFKAFGLSVETGAVVEGPQVTRVKVR